MSEDLDGAGSAENAQVQTDPVQVNEPDVRAEADRVVEASQRKVDKQREHLAGAEQSLAAAIAARDGG